MCPSSKRKTAREQNAQWHEVSFPLFFRLQGSHAGTRFHQASVPRFTLGTMWSRVVAGASQ